MRQDRFRPGIANAIGQARERIKTIDRDLWPRDLRSQAGLPEAVERAMPEGDDVRPHRVALAKACEPKDQAQARAVFAFSS